MTLDRLTGSTTFDIAASLRCQIDDHAARPHRRQLRIAYQPRRGAPRYQRGDDDILLGDMAGYQLGLCRLIFGAGFAGVTALPFALDPGNAFDKDRLGTK